MAAEATAPAEIGQSTGIPPLNPEGTRAFQEALRQPLPESPSTSVDPPVNTTAPAASTNIDKLLATEAAQAAIKRASEPPELPLTLRAALAGGAPDTAHSNPNVVADRAITDLRRNQQNPLNRIRNLLRTFLRRPKAAPAG